MTEDLAKAMNLKPGTGVLLGSVEKETPAARAGLKRGDVILSVNGQPARDATGKVVAAVMLCREVSEEIAMAIEVRRMANERQWDDEPPTSMHAV